MQELLGHRTLEMTRKVHAKIHAQTKRQALGKLPYGRGSSGPEHVIPVQFGHQAVTAAPAAGRGVTQAAGG